MRGAIRVTLPAVFLLLIAPVVQAEIHLPDPAILAVSSSFPGFGSSYALDENPNTDWASLSNGTNTYMDFDFGSPALVTRVAYTDRRTSGGANGSANLNPADNVTAYDLIFSTDAVFGNGDDQVQSVVSGPCCVTDSVVINGGAGISARYLRFDVTGTAGANPGAAEFEFYTAGTYQVPTVSTWALLAMGGLIGLLALTRLR